MKHNIITRCVKNYLVCLNSLPSITIDKLIINYKSIHSFIISNRNNNDINNKTRETIIYSIINNKIPPCYFIYSKQWTKLKYNIFNYLHELYSPIESVTCKQKGGRKYNYDFEITINNIHIFNVELKFNTLEIMDAPQFVSPMKPSQYLSSSYEEYYYDNYLYKLAQDGLFDVPLKTDYLSQIHKTCPPCLQAFQDKYYKGCKQSSQYSNDVNDIIFYEKAKQYANESISQFIINNELNITLLSEYLIKSQQNKHYMLYKNNKFYLETIHTDDFMLVHYEKMPGLNSYRATSQSGKKINILLRWKNGNGIAFPSFQISLSKH